MASPQGPARRPTITSRAEKQRLREIAQLRARRAARRSNEAAAGKRRMVLSGFFAALTVIVGLIAALSTAVSWVWTVLPLGALVAALAVSRRAAIRFEEVSRAEQARLEELMGLVPMDEAHAVESRAEPVAVPAGRRAAVAEAVKVEVSAVEVEAPVESAVLVADEIVDASAEVEVEAQVEAEATELARAAASNVEAAEAVEASETVEDVEAPVEADAPASWVPTPIPAPMYAQRPRVGGRLVHPDTDLRGIPKVAASVPMRPSGVSESGAPLRSTEEVAAAQPVSFDLDAILESRRAL